MPNRVFIFGITVLAVVIIIGGASWTLFGPNEPTAPSVPGNSQSDSENPSDQPEPESPGTTPEPSENSSETPTESLVLPQEQARDAAMAYVRSAHPGISQFLTDLSWNGGRLETEEVDTEKYMFYASDWAVTVEWPLAENPTYKVSAQYAGDQVQIIWEGTYRNGVVSETKYSATR